MILWSDSETGNVIFGSAAKGRGRDASYSKCDRVDNNFAVTDKCPSFWSWMRVYLEREGRGGRVNEFSKSH